MEIEFKASDSISFEIYVSLGGYIHTQDGLYIYFPEGNNIKMAEWKKFFKMADCSICMHSLNYFILEYNDLDEDSFINLFGAEIYLAIKNNYDLFCNFILKWYEPNSSLFKGLDFTYDDISDEFEDQIFDDNENRISINLKDGSMIRFIDGNDDINQLFVLKSDFEELQIELAHLLSLFK